MDTGLCSLSNIEPPQQQSPTYPTFPPTHRAPKLCMKRKPLSPLSLSLSHSARIEIESRKEPEETFSVIVHAPRPNGCTYRDRKERKKEVGPNFASCSRSNDALEISIHTERGKGREGRKRKKKMELLSQPQNWRRSLMLGRIDQNRTALSEFPNASYVASGGRRTPENMDGKVAAGSIVRGGPAVSIVHVGPV